MQETQIEHLYVYSWKYIFLQHQNKLPSHPPQRLLYVKCHSQPPMVAAVLIKWEKSPQTPLIHYQVRNASRALHMDHHHPLLEHRHPRHHRRIHHHLHAGHEYDKQIPASRPHLAIDQGSVKIWAKNKTKQRSWPPRTEKKKYFGHKTNLTPKIGNLPESLRIICQLESWLLLYLGVTSNLNIIQIKNLIS